MGTHFWRIFEPLFGGLFVANPLPPIPFRNLRGKRKSGGDVEWVGIEAYLYFHTPPANTLADLVDSRKHTKHILNEKRGLVAPCG